MLKKIFTSFLAAALLLTGCAKKEESGAADSLPEESTVSQPNTSEDENMLSEKSFPASEQYARLIGRTAENEGILWLALSASGVEFTFTGTSASFTLVGDNMTENAEKQPRYAVYINGERTMDELLDSAEKNVTVFTSDEPAQATVKLLKLSEAQESTMGIKSINVTSAEDITPTAQAEDRLKIEFIGDSITCGYGVDDEDRDHHFKTSTEDATKAYAFKTAMALDADYSLVSYSGNGIISGYTDNGTRQTSQLVPAVYKKFAKSWGNYDMFNVQEVDWDFSRFQPDYIVINLGTNDASYTKGKQDRVQEYIDGYVDFLTVVRENNPDAHIICSLGVMGADLYSAIEKAAAAYTEKTGDANLSTFKFSTQDGNKNGYAADWHPTEASQDIAAAELTEYIKSLIAG